MPADPGRELFEQIAESTGGGVFDWTTRHDLIGAIRDALADLRSQYSLAYKPPPGAKHRFRRIKVRVRQPNLVLRTREGYFYKQEKK